MEEIFERALDTFQQPYFERFFGGMSDAEVQPGKVVFTRYAAGAVQDVFTWFASVQKAAYERLERDGVYGCVYGSYSRPIDGIWARIEGARYVDVVERIPHITPWTYVVTPWAIEPRVVEDYELTPIGELLTPLARTLAAQGAKP